MIDMDKIVEYWSGKALEALDVMRREKADPRNPEVANIVSKNLKILCAADTLMDEDAGAVSAAGDFTSHGAYPDGNSYEDGMGGISNARGRGRHYVRGHYSYAMGARSYNSQHGGALSRMMDAADPREKEILERLLRKVDA